MILLTFVLATLILACFLILYLEVINYRLKKIVNKIQGPPALPIIGNVLQFGKTPTEIGDLLFSWWNQFGKTNYRFWVGYFGTIMVSDIKDVEFVLSSNTLIEKSDVYDLLQPWLGLGLLTSTGAKWFKHRKMITPSFHFQILQTFHEVMNANSKKFIEKLRVKSAGDTIFDFQDAVHYFTLDVICDTAMGVSINAMDNNDSEIVKAFKDMCYNVNMRAYHPIKRFSNLYKLLPEYSGFLKTLHVLQNFTYDVIKRRQKMLHETKKKQPIDQEEKNRPKLAFLDNLLTATIDGCPLTLQEIYEEVSTFIFEGHDTTATGIAFTVYILSRHPTIQQKAFEEQLHIFSESDLLRDATFSEIAEMKYLDLVIRESQRLYPSVPIIGRRADRDYDMNGTLIPKGTIINLFLIAMGYNDQIFEEPFYCRPERFDLERRNTKPSAFEIVPFSAGPRNCIGQKFALLELKTVISKILRTFEILPPLDELVSRDNLVQNFLGLSPKELEKMPPPNKYDPVLSMVLTLKSDNGLMMRLRPRKL